MMARGSLPRHLYGRFSWQRRSANPGRRCPAKCTELRYLRTIRERPRARLVKFREDRPAAWIPEVLIWGGRNDGERFYIWVLTDYATREGLLEYAETSS